MAQDTDQQKAPVSNATWGKSRLLALWIVIASLVVVGLASVVAILLGQFGTLLWNTILTVFALGVFAFFTWIESFAAERRPVWETAGVVALWGVILLLWTIKIWMPYNADIASVYEDNGAIRFFQAVAIAGVARLAFVLAQLVLRAYQRYRESALASILAIVAVALATLEAILLIVPMMLSPWVNFGEFYSKAVLIALVLAAVATGIVPLIRLAVRRSGKFDIPDHASPWGSQVDREPAPAAGAPAAHEGSFPAPAAPEPNVPSSHAPASSVPSAPQAPVPDSALSGHPESAPQPPSAAEPTEPPKLLPWPRYADGTPLPMLPNGQPDFNAPEPPPHA